MKKINLSLLMAWIGSFLAILMSIIPGISALFSGQTSNYNPEVAILTATLVAVVWYVYWTYRVVLVPSYERENERRLLKQGFSTALLAELQWLEKILDGIYHKELWSFDPIKYPILEQVEQNLHIFSPETIGKIATFHYRLLIVQGSLKNKIDGYELNPDEIKEFYGHDDESTRTKHKKWMDKTLRVKAILAAEALVELVSSLRLEGGSMPAILKGIAFGKDELPPMPQRAFPKGETRKLDDLV